MTKKNSAKKPDKFLLWIISAIFLIGIVSLLSASIPQSKRDLDNLYGYFSHQLLFGILPGIALGFLAYIFPYKKLKKLAPHIAAASLLLMVLVFVPAISVQSRGAQRWLDFKFFTVQPSELIKLAFVIYLAAWLSTHIRDVAKKTTLVPFLFFLGILMILLILQPDLSTLGIIVMTAIIMYFVAGAPFKYLAVLGISGTVALITFVRISPYRFSRFLTLINPSSDPLGAGYQLNQALIAVGAGRIWGAGLLQGMQKNFLPLSMNDSIYAVWAEETGFIGAIILVLLYFLFAWRGFRISSNIQDYFGKLLMIGITSWIFLQAFINIGSIIGLIPLTGVTLPLISYGSSSMIVTLIAMGFMLQLSKSSAGGGSSSGGKT